MSSIGTGYDLSASQFSPDGRVFQVEYALKAVDNSSTAIGLRGKDGVVLAVEKLIQSKLHETGANKRIFNIDKHIGMAVAGLHADSRMLADIASDEAADYRLTYQCPVPLEYLQQRVSSYMHVYTLYSAVRPYGSSAIIASFENNEPYLYMIDPSGMTFRFNGCAAGKARQAAKTEMEKVKFNDMPLRALVKEAAKIVYTLHDEVKDKEFELELSWVGKDTNGIHERVPKDLFAEANEYGKQSVQDSDSDEE